MGNIILRIFFAPLFIDISTTLMAIFSPPSASDATARLRLPTRREDYTAARCSRQEYSIAYFDSVVVNLALKLYYHLVLGGLR